MQTLRTPSCNRMQYHHTLTGRPAKFRFTLRYVLWNSATSMVDATQHLFNAIGDRIFWKTVYDTVRFGSHSPTFRKSVLRQYSKGSLGIKMKQVPPKRWQQKTVSCHHHETTFTR